MAGGLRRTAQRSLAQAGEGCGVAAVQLLFGIWSKMQRQQKAFHEIYDVAALRIIAECRACRALAVVYDTFRPIPVVSGHIGLPSPMATSRCIRRDRRLRRSVESAPLRYRRVGIRHRRPLEVQGGWLPASSSSEAERFNWLRQLVERQQEGANDGYNDYLSSIKGLFDEEVFVPRGRRVGCAKGRPRWTSPTGSIPRWGTTATVPASMTGSVR